MKPNLSLAGPQAPLTDHRSYHAVRPPSRRRSLGLMLLAGLSLVLLRAGVASAFFAETDQSNAGGAAAAVLSPPAAATATTLGSGAIQVAWTPATTQLAGAQYQVVRTGGPGSPVVVCTESVSVTTSCVDAGLALGTAYDYQVRAVLHAWRSTPVAAAATTAVPTLAITLGGSTTVAGAPLGVTRVEALFGAGVDTTYAGTKTMLWSGLASSPAASTLPIYPGGTITFVDGVAEAGSGFTPSTVTTYAAGTNTLWLREVVHPAVIGSVDFSVTNAAAAALRFAIQPGDGIAGEPLAPQPTVHVEDAYGNVAADNTELVQLTLSSGAFASGFSTAQTTALAGVAVFTGVQVDATGTYSVAAADLMPPTLTGATSNPFTISPGTGSILQFLQQPSGATAGVSMSPAPTVQILDQFGNATSRTTTVTLSVLTNPCGGDPGLSGHSVAAVNGVATFSNLQLTKSCAGYVVDASDGPAATSSSSFSVSPAAASQLAFTSAPFSGPNSATANLGPITVQQRDQFGNVVIATGADTTVSLSQFAGTGIGVFANTLLGSTLGPAQVTIPAGSSTASFYYGSSQPGSTTITAGGPAGFNSASLTGTVTAAGLDIVGFSYQVGAGFTNPPTVSCNTIGPNRICNVAGVGSGGSVAFNVRFAGTSGPFVYSGSPSTISLTGHNSGILLIAGGASTSAGRLSAGHTLNTLGTSTLNFATGGYTITINVVS